MMMDKEIAYQEQKEAATDLRRQVLKDKFSTAARLKVGLEGTRVGVPLRDKVQSDIGNADGAEAEVSASTFQESISPPAIVRGSKFRKAKVTKTENLRLQLEEQEWVASKATALATSIRNAGNTEQVEEAAAVVQQRSPHNGNKNTLATSIRNAGNTEQVEEEEITTQQPTKHDGNKNMRAFLSDLATLRLTACSRGTPGYVSEATSPPAGNSISGISSITSPATALKVTNYSSVPHNALPVNEVDEVMGNNMFSMAQ